MDYRSSNDFLIPYTVMFKMTINSRSVSSNILDTLGEQQICADVRTDKVICLFAPKTALITIKFNETTPKRPNSKLRDRM